ncbi:MAG: transcription elongation factor GreA, partial [Dehalococcoidia bacterium]|nr:transcription elongation factor GreA [Dehalococcoidia bacterium]
MSEKEIFLTPEGLAKLEEELEHLRTVRRHEVAEKIQQAKELRSSVTSPEYEEAKNEQGFVEGRILEIERIIKNATIIHHEDVNIEFVEVGNEVRVQLQDGSEEHYTIVGSAEANPG